MFYTMHQISRLPIIAYLGDDTTVVVQLHHAVVNHTTQQRRYFFVIDIRKQFLFGIRQSHTVDGFFAIIAMPYNNGQRVSFIRGIQIKYERIQTLPSD